MLVVFTILTVSLLFVNGFADAPSTVAGLISTRTLTPSRAVLLSAFFNLCGTVAMAYISSDVAETVSGIVRFGEDGKHALRILCAGICAVVVWSVVSWRLGIPTSGSHALVSGITGAALAGRMGLSAVNLKGWGLILAGLLVSTLPAFLLAKLIFSFFTFIFENFDRRRVITHFRRSQIWSAATTSFINGGQNSQKYMGVFMLGISLYTGYGTGAEFKLPLPVIAVSALCISAGTLAGGGRVIKKTGMQMAKFDSSGASAANSASSAVLAACSFLGIPASTAHTKTCAMMGVGSHRYGGGADMKIIGQMLLAWCLTFPVCGALGFVLATFIIIF